MIATTLPEPGEKARRRAAGRLYGVTLAGGAHGLGSVFQLAQDSSGAWQRTVLHDFTGYPGDGAHPAAGLIFDSAGNLYGTTERGGSGTCSTQLKTEGCGTVFELSYVSMPGVIASVAYMRGVLAGMA